MFIICKTVSVLVACW